MRSISFILLCLYSYVGAATNNATYTVCDTCQYATLQLAVDAHDQDLVTNDSSITFEIKEGSSPWADQGATTIDGYDADATHFVTVVTTGNARHSGVWDGTTAYRLSATYRPLFINDDFVVIDGLQVEVTGTGDSRVCIEPGGAGEVIKNCILLHTSTGGIGGAIGRGGGGVPVAEYYYNNIAIEPDGHFGIAFSPAGNDCNSYIINNTIIGFDVGVRIIGNDAVIRNNIFWGTKTVIYTETACGTSPYSHHNVTDSTSISYPGCGSCGTGDITSMSDPFVSSGTGNYLLAVGSSPINAGSDESSVLGESVGILGNARSSWDIGADEFSGEEPPAALLPIIRTIIIE